MVLVDSAINGLFVGFGSAIGSYLATKYAIKHIDSVEVKILERIKNFEDRRDLS